MQKKKAFGLRYYMSDYRLTLKAMWILTDQPAATILMS